MSVEKSSNRVDFTLKCEPQQSFSVLRFVENGAYLCK